MRRNLGALIREGDRKRAQDKYWRKRQTERGEAELTERPAWDGRLFEQWAPVRARKGDTIFRLKLWWDHLPTPAVLQRGQEVTVDEKCAYCECRGRVSTWHLLAQC